MDVQLTAVVPNINYMTHHTHAMKTIRKKHGHERKVRWPWSDNFNVREKIVCDYVYTTILYAHIIILHVYIVILQVYIIIFHVYKIIHVYMNI